MTEVLAAITIASLLIVLICVITIYVNEMSWRKHEAKLLDRNEELEEAIFRCGLHCRDYLHKRGIQYGRK